MAPIKLLFDMAGVVALAYMACGPAAQVVFERRPEALALVGTTAPVPAAGDHEPSEAKPVRRSEDGLFYVWAEINDTPVRFLVDTGASVVVLTPADARRAGVTPQSGGGRIETASGSSRMQWARLERIEVAGRELHDLDAAVVAKGLRVSLLGQNLLTRLGPVSIDGNHLNLN